MSDSLQHHSLFSLDTLTTERILAGLNPAQQEAVQATEGPVLIIAGPGSGKTRTLTHRIAYLLASGKAHPHEVLALTFTNKAAREMKERVSQLVGEQVARDLWMGTFHSVFARILRREAERLGYSADFTIYDQEDSERLIKSLMQQHGIDTTKVSPRSIRSRISGAKNQLVSPQEYARLATGYHEQLVARIYGVYQEQLRRANAMDFDDLLVLPIQLFEHYPEVLQAYQQKWRYIHIDEYQDTNRAQYKIARMLSGAHRNLCVVGDDAQSIYAFRGADIRNILDFKRDFPDARIIRLEQNYRSTRRILKLADSIIRRNREQLEKTLWTENQEGEYIWLLEALSERDEAQKIERIIRNLRVQEGYAYRDFAVLYRTNAQSRSLEEALRRGGIPYRIIGGLSFYRRKEIKDVLAYLRLVVNPNDVESLRRVINYPTRGIGMRTLERIFTYAHERGISVWQAIEQVNEIGLSARATQAVHSFYQLIARYASKAREMPADELALALVRESGMIHLFQTENTPESLARLENVQELLNAIVEFTEQAPEDKSIGAFLQEVSLYTDLDTLEAEDNRVTLMTLHASKGLEFPVVFIAGLEENLFPLSGATQDPKELEEERRLLYVGITRAKERLFLSYARNRYRFGKQEPMLPSQFLEELDTSVIRREGGRDIRKQSSHQELKRASQGSLTSSYAPVGRRSGSVVGGDRIVPGMQVAHQQFGIGKVLSVEGQGEQARAVVYFKSVGQKKLILKYARLKVID